MLGSFLSSYPTGSMQTELVQIYNGKYIVKASLQIEGVTRATAMATAETVETAEDSALLRVITFFAGTTTTQQPLPTLQQQPSLDNSSHNGAAITSEKVTVPVTVPVEIQKPQPTPDTAPISNQETNLTNNTNAASEPPVEAIAPEKTKTKAETKTKTTQDISQFTEATTSIPDLSKVSETTFNNEPLFDAYEEFAPTVPKFEAPSPLDDVPSNFDVSEKPTQVPNNVTPFTGRNYSSPEPIDPPEEIELPPVSNIVPSSTTTSKRKKKTEATDQSDDIAKIGVEMQRLGWTTEQGRDYLVKQYGKRSRHLLSADELRDFRIFLESQSTPEDPLAFDPIAGF